MLEISDPCLHSLDSWVIWDQSSSVDFLFYQALLGNALKISNLNYSVINSGNRLRIFNYLMIYNSAFHSLSRSLVYWIWKVLKNKIWSLYLIEQQKKKRNLGLKKAIIINSYKSSYSIIVFFVIPFPSIINICGSYFLIISYSLYLFFICFNENYF